MSEHEIPPDRMGLCCGCGKPLGECDPANPTLATAICEHCSRFEWAFNAVKVQAGWLFRDTVRLLAGELGALIERAKDEHGVVSLSAIVPCPSSECGFLHTATVTMPRLWAKRRELQQALAEALPDTCARCNRVIPLTLRLAAPVGGLEDEE